MGFLSWQFWFLFAFVVLLFWMIPSVFKKYMLILCSFLFYFSNGILSLGILCYLIGISWMAAGIVHRVRRKFVLWMGILFTVLPFCLVRGFQVTGGGGIPAILGLAYTTMMALGYLVDMHMQRYDTVGFVDYIAFLSFFPYAVSGPIERADKMCLQICQLKNRKFSWKELQSGMTLILYGLFVKLVVADRLGILVDQVFGHYREYIGVELVLALVFYGIEIYCDFSAVSDIARGIARCFGISIINNFQQPYFAKSIGEFWRRWHISLSGWLRDYVYIPLGGNRKGAKRQSINICITFLVSGLWHGFSLPFLLWGLLHGMYQAVGKLTAKIRKKFHRFCGVQTTTIGHQIFQMISTFVLVDFAWLFFRIKDINTGIGILRNMILGMQYSIFKNSWLKLGLDQQDWNILLLGLIIIVIVDVLHTIYKDKFMNLFLNDNLLVRYTVWIGLFIVTVLCGIYGPGYESTTFIYRGF